MLKDLSSQTDILSEDGQKIFRENLKQNHADLAHIVDLLEADGLKVLGYYAGNTSHFKIGLQPTEGNDFEPSIALTAELNKLSFQVHFAAIDHGQLG